jgi:hypothetical protein
MKQSWFGRPERDPELRDALRRLETAPPPVNEDALRARISLAAQPALRALRGQADPRPPFRPWWAWTAGWARLTVPAGAGVALASALLLVRAGAPVLQAVAADTVAVSSILVSAGADEAAATQMLDQLLAPANQDWLFTEAMGRP